MQISCHHYLKFYFFSYLSNFLYYLRDQGVYTHVFRSRARSSEVKVPQVEQEVVRGVGDPRAAPPMDTEDMEIAFKSTTGMVTKQSHGRHIIYSHHITIIGIYNIK